jgi:hypothetical protein
MTVNFEHWTSVEMTMDVEGKAFAMEQDLIVQIQVTMFKIQKTFYYRTMQVKGQSVIRS